MNNLRFEEKFSERTTIKRIIMLLIFVLSIYFILCLIGIIHYPKWYIIADFKFNKKHFEVVLNDKEIERLTTVNEIDKYTMESQKSLRKLFKYGIYNRFGKSYERNYDNGDYYITDEIESCVFVTKSIRYDFRGVLYSDTDKSEITLGDGNVYKCYPLGGGWYYYEFAYKSVWE